jgi:hypothetical protein
LLKFTGKKPGVLNCFFLFPTCAKTRLPATAKFIRGLYPQNPANRGRERALAGYDTSIGGQGRMISEGRKEYGREEKGGRRKEGKGRGKEDGQGFEKEREGEKA